MTLYFILLFQGDEGVRQSTLVPQGVIQETAFEDAKTLLEGMLRGQKVSGTK